MPRRRMIDPDFWRDSRIKRLSLVERLFFLGMVNHADDEGRLAADPAFLRSIIFPYDDFSLEEIKSMRDHIVATNPNIQFYQNEGEEYLYFRKWTRYQKPSHPQPSKLPQPPELHETVREQIQELVHEQDQPDSGTIPSQVRSGQSSLGKDRLGKVREVLEDFTEFLTSEKDLTDFLTDFLTNNLPRGPTHIMSSIRKLWQQGTGAEIDGVSFQVIFQALQKYPIPVLARSIAKSVKYSPGKRKPSRYIQTVLDEQMEKETGGSRSPPAGE